MELAVPRKVLYLMAVLVATYSSADRALADAFAFRASAASSYDSNVLRSAADPHADILYSGSVGFDINANLGRKKATLGYSGATRKHEMQKQESVDRHNASVSLQSLVGKTGKVNVSGEYTLDVVPRGGSGDVIDPSMPKAVFNRTGFNAQSIVIVPDLPLLIDFSLSASATRFQNPVYLMRDKNSYGTKVELGYRWMPNVTYMAALGLETKDYANVTDASGGILTASPQVGMRWQAASKSTAEIMMGTKLTHFPAAEYADQLNYSLNAGVTWKRKPYSAISGKVFYGNVDSIDPLVRDYLNASVMVGIEHAFTNRWQTSMAIKLDYDVWKNWPGEVIPGVSGGMRYGMNEHVVISFGFDASARITADPNRAYNGYLTFIKLNYRL